MGTITRGAYLLLMYLLLMARDLMNLMRATSITKAIGRGGPWKSRLFGALTWQRAKRVPFGPQKVDLHGYTRVVTRPTICDCSDTETEGRRELTEHDVLSCLAGGRGGGGALICTVIDGRTTCLCHDVLYPPALPRSCSAESFWQSLLLQPLV